MEDREHRVRLAAAKRRLEPDNRVATHCAKTLRRSRQDALQAFCEKGDAIEGAGCGIAFSCEARVYGEQVGCELRFLESVSYNVRVRKGHFDPWLERLGQIIGDRQFEFWRSGCWGRGAG